MVRSDIAHGALFDWQRGKAQFVPARKATVLIVLICYTALALVEQNG